MSLVAFKIFSLVLSDIDISEHQPFFFFFKKIIYLFWLFWVFLAVPGLSLVAVGGAILCCRAQASHRGGFSCWGAQALGAWVSVVAAHKLGSWGALAFHCSVACGSVPDQGSNPCLLHWQADSYPLYHQGSLLSINLSFQVLDKSFLNCTPAGLSLELRAHLTCAFGLAHRHPNFNISNKWCIITLPWSLLHPAFLSLDNLPSLSSSRQEFGNDPLLHLNLFCHQNRLPKLSPCQSYLQHLSNFPLSLLSLLTASAQALISFLDFTAAASKLIFLPPTLIPCHPFSILEPKCTFFF